MARAWPPANGSRLPKVIKTVIANHGGRNSNIHVQDSSVLGPVLAASHSCIEAPQIFYS